MCVRASLLSSLSLGPPPRCPRAAPGPAWRGEAGGMAGARVEVRVPEGGDGRLFRLAAHCAGVGPSLALSPGAPALAATAPDGARVTEPNTICRLIAGLSRRGQQLLGETAEQQALVLAETAFSSVASLCCEPDARSFNWPRIGRRCARGRLTRRGAGSQISEWLSFRHTKFTPLTEEGLKQIDDWLLTRTCLAGPAISLADLVTFATLYNAVVRASAVWSYCQMRERTPCETDSAFLHDRSISRQLRSTALAMSSAGSTTCNMLPTLQRFTRLST